MDKLLPVSIMNYEPPPKPAFANSMDWGNEPGGETANAGANDDRPQNFGDRLAGKSDGDSGMVTAPSVADFPKLVDPHAPPGYPDTAGGEKEISDFGLNESVEVGHDGSVHTYGLSRS